MSIVVSLKIPMTDINGCTGILMDIILYMLRQNGFAGMSVFEINRESSLTGFPKRDINS